MLQERESSPAELSRWLDVTLGTTAYHVRVLRNAGLIVLTRERVVGGAVERLYEATQLTKLDPGAWSRLPSAAKQLLIGSRLEIVRMHVSAAVAKGGFERADAVIERTTMRVDGQGWRALSTEIGRFLDRVSRIEADAAARIASSDAQDSSGASVVALAFETSALASQLPD